MKMEVIQRMPAIIRVSSLLVRIQGIVNAMDRGGKHGLGEEILLNKPSVITGTQRFFYLERWKHTDRHISMVEA